MADPEKLLNAVVREMEKLATIDRSRAAAAERRDAAIRAARAAGITYARIRTATGLSPVTISKALGEK